MMGSPEFAVPSLQAVARACDLRVVVCQPDRPAGRGRQLTAPAVKLAAAEFGVPIEQPQKLKDGALARALRTHDLDVIVVVAFGRILPREILTLPRYGCVNVHGSILPRWRGAAPIQRAVLDGDAETGVAIMAMDEGLDTGAVYRTTTTPIEPLETSGQLFERLAKLGAQTLESFLADFPDVPPPQPQDHARATLAPPLSKAEGATDWDRPAITVVDHVRGMDPWPVAFTLRGEETLKLFDARPSTCQPGDLPPGTILGVDDVGMHVCVRDGAVAIGSVQAPGKQRLPAAAYAAGRRFRPNERLG